MGRPPRPTPPVLPIIMEEAPPSISPKERSDVQAATGSLWPHAGARNPLPEGGPSLGRPHRFGARAGEKLAADGVRLADIVSGARIRTCLAVDQWHRYTLGR